MSLAYDTTLQNSRLDLIKTAVDAGTGAGKLRIYDGSQPAKGAAITTEVLLSEHLFTDPSFGAAAAGVLTAAAIADDTALATSTGTWLRVVDSDNTFVYDGTVGTSGADLNLNTTSFTTGLNVSITNFLTITEGNG